jgi:hypothetical protein
MKRLMLFLMVIFSLSFAATATITKPAIDNTPAYILDSAKVEPYIVVASKASRYPLPATRPAVVVMPHAWFVERTCDSVEPCNVLGVFISKLPEYIFINEKTPDFLWRTILVHEYVHYLQWANGQDLSANQTCAQRALIEAEAYVAAYRFELEHRDHTVGLDVTASNCKEGEK